MPTAFLFYLHFYRHLKNMHKEKYQAYENAKMKNDEGSPQSQQSLAGFVKMKADSNKYRPKHEAQLKITTSLVENLIIGYGLPLSIVVNDYFGQFMNDVHPKFNLPSRPTITQKLIPAVKEKRIIQIREQLSQAKSVSLTVDIWTDRRMHSFLAITAHTFVNLRADVSLINFSAFKGQHTGKSIAAGIEKTVNDFRLRGKLEYVVTDNASNMRKALDILKEVMTVDENKEENGEVGQPLPADLIDDETLFSDLDEEDATDVEDVFQSHSVERLSCFAHSLQLVVKDGLDNCAAIRSVIAKSTALANTCHQSAGFKESFEQQFGSNRTIPKANSTKRSSTHHQLSCIAQLDQQQLDDLLRRTGHKNLIFTPKDTAILKELVEILQPFSEVFPVILLISVPTL
jgi:hypothetical protein